jgi:hypothetical protein
MALLTPLRELAHTRLVPGLSVRGYIRSTMMAKASPPPIHKLANPRLA